MLRQETNMLVARTSANGFVIVSGLVSDLSYLNEFSRGQIAPKPWPEQELHRFATTCSKRSRLGPSFREMITELFAVPSMS